MPSLHVHLKQGIDFDYLDAQPKASHEEGTGGYYDLAQRAAKRRRIEHIATQYLRGRAPLILSAGLKGPFNKNWKNPWAEKLRKGETVPGRAGGLKQANRERAKSRSAAAAQPDKDRKRTHTRKLSPLPSPETSRAAPILSQTTDLVDEQQDQVEAPPCDLPMLDNDSGGTEFFSVDAEPPIAIDASESNPFWLRRRPLDGVRIAQPQAGNSDPSPTHSRSGSRPMNESGEVQLVPPRLPLARPRSSPIPTNSPNPKSQSSASASVATSSPAKPRSGVPAQAGKVSFSEGNQPALPSLVHRLSSEHSTAASSVAPAESVVASALTATAVNVAMEHVAEITPRAQLHGPQSDPTRTTGSSKLGAAEHAPTFTPINATPRIAGPGSSFTVPLKDTHPSIVEGHRAATNLALLAIEKARDFRPTTEDLHQSAERCAHSAPSSSAKGTNGRTKRPSSNNQRRRGNAQVTSPTSASSTGLAYRKVGEAQSKKGLQKSKPRPVTFSSSPKVRVDTLPIPEAPPQELSPVGESRSARPDVYEVPRSPAPENLEQERSIRTSRTSGYSTQAAMMLAQLEFQEGTMPSVASETIGPWLPPHHHTPHPYVEGPSLAFTPFSEFNAELDKRHPRERISQEVPISTQELLLAASPFAFSTIKKPPRPQGSSLRFTVFPSGDQSEHGDHVNGAKSPTPSERIPLRARNSQLPSQSTVSEKGSQEHPSLLEPKLPQLDFRTSLDDLGPNGDLEFTDRFVRNLKGMT
jgi:hypothetical protein